MMRAGAGQDGFDYYILGFFFFFAIYNHVPTSLHKVEVNNFEIYYIIYYTICTSINVYI